MGLYSWEKKELGVQFEGASAIDISSTGRIFIGTGNTQGVDASVIYSDDDGDSFTLLTNAFPSGTFNVSSILVISDDEIIIGTSGGAGESGIGIYRYANSTLTLVQEVLKTNTEVVFNIRRSGSNIIATTGFGGSGQTAEIYRSSDGGVTWNVASQIAVSGSADAYASLSIEGAICYSSLIRSGASSEIFKSTDSGDSWQSVYVVTGINNTSVVNVSPSKIIRCDIDNNSYHESTDDTNWSSVPYIGITPTDLGMYYNSDEQTTIIPSNSDGQIAITTDNGSTWGLSLISPDVDTVYRCICDNVKLYAATGSGAGDGDLWVGTPLFPVANFSGTPTSGEAPLEVQFTDLSANSPTSWSWKVGSTEVSTDQNPLIEFATAGVYSITLEATNISGTGTETKTGYITVTEPTVTKNAKINYNGDEINFDIDYSADSLLSLPYMQMVDSVGNISYRKFSSDTTISGSWPIDSREFQDKLDEYISGEDYDVAGSQPLLTVLGGVYPLSPLYNLTGGQGVTLELDNDGHLDFFGNITGYSAVITPVGTLTDEDFTGQSSCTASDWTLNGVGLPFPTKGKFKPNLNGSNRVSQSFGGYTDTLSTARTQGDTVEVELDCDAVKASELLLMLRDTDWSAGTVTAVFTASYKPWGWAHAATTVKVMLADTKVRIKQTGPQRVLVKIRLQYQGV